MTALHEFIQNTLPAVEHELQHVISQTRETGLEELHAMMAYHMGWEGEHLEARGKRVRPLLVLLTAAAADGEWEKALPAAAAVELVHNFSLLHDDVEDNSQLRRGRTTVWVKWGIPHAINTGDAMFTLAFQAALRLQETSPPSVVVQAIQILQQTCLHLTQGQFLDISYQDRDDLTLADYWPMVTGKTAALLGACTEMGALIAQAGEGARSAYREFGLELGLAFQALDDYLGIWGDTAKIGKSNLSDLLERKKTLPVLYGLEQQGEFAKRWATESINMEEASLLAEILAQEGARDFTLQKADELTRQALATLKRAQPRGEAGEALFELAHQLLKREV